MEEIIDILNNNQKIKFEYYNRDFLLKRIKYRMISLDIESLDNYINYLKKNKKENRRFMEDFTIKYTYFFRNYEIYNRLEKYIENLQMKKKDILFIWSCACATGEEPYSIAMFLDRCNKNIINFPKYKIIASDINENAIEKAKMGEYSEYSLHETPSIYKEIYFTRTAKTPSGFKYRIKDEIIDKVEFICEDNTLGHGKNYIYDIIFCRNLLLYINKESRKRVLNILNSKLKRNGLLVLGKTEKIEKIDPHFKPLDSTNRFYIKLGNYSKGSSNREINTNFDFNKYQKLVSKKTKQRKKKDRKRSTNEPKSVLNNVEKTKYCRNLKNLSKPKRIEIKRTPEKHNKKKNDVNPPVDKYITENKIGDNSDVNQEDSSNYNNIEDKLEYTLEKSEKKLELIDNYERFLEKNLKNLIF
ncbi:MAG: hypothetical protein GF329_04690, partial [Candidatus Lokiarchaeota archaeon]|nr:hypothetical protein [Candidatus Lokiarchaeota archaeon]